MAVRITPSVFYTILITAIAVSLVLGALAIWKLRDSVEVMKLLPETDPRHHEAQKMRNWSIAMLVLSAVALAVVAFVYFGGHERLIQSQAFQRVRNFLTPQSLVSDESF